MHGSLSLKATILTYGGVFLPTKVLNLKQKFLVIDGILAASSIVLSSAGCFLFSFIECDKSLTKYKEIFRVVIGLSEYQRKLGRTLWAQFHSDLLGLQRNSQE